MSLSTRNFATASDYKKHPTKMTKLTAEQTKYVSSWGQIFVTAANKVVVGFKTWLMSLGTVGLMEDGGALFVFAPCCLLFVSSSLQTVCLVVGPLLKQGVKAPDPGNRNLLRTAQWPLSDFGPDSGKATPEQLRAKTARAPEDCSGAHAPHLAARALGLDVVTTHACDCATGPQKFSHRNFDVEVWHANLWQKDTGVARLVLPKWSILQPVAKKSILRPSAKEAPGNLESIRKSGGSNFSSAKSTTFAMVC